MHSLFLLLSSILFLTWPLSALPESSTPSDIPDWIVKNVEAANRFPNGSIPKLFNTNLTSGLPKKPGVPPPRPDWPPRNAPIIDFWSEDDYKGERVYSVWMQKEWKGHPQDVHDGWRDKRPDSMGLFEPLHCWLITWHYREGSPDKIYEYSPHFQHPGWADISNPWHQWTEQIACTW